MSLRDIERESIRAFVQDCADKGYLSGKVCDFGAGRMPYRPIIEAAGGEYVPYDRHENPGSCAQTDLGPDVYMQYAEYDAVLMTQVWQYIEPDVLQAMLCDIGYCGSFLKCDGVFLATGPTNWPRVEWEDRWRQTPSGVEGILKKAGFREVEVGERAHVRFENEEWPLGWYAVARPLSS